MNSTGKAIDGSSPYGIGRFLWLKVLLGGLLMFILLERALATTGNINYIPSLLVVGACTVPLSFVVFLYGRGKTPSVSVGNLLVCMVWGGAVGTVLAGLIEYHTLMRLSALPTLLVGTIEELVKLVVPMLFIFGRKERGELDCIVIGAAAGAGFAVLEGMGYGLTALLFTGGNATDASRILLVRALMAPAAHIAWTALAADALWRLRSGAHGAVQYAAMTVFGVILLHALWDSATPLGGFMFVVVGTASLGWLALRVRKAVRRPQSGLASLVAVLTLM